MTRSQKNLTSDDIQALVGLMRFIQKWDQDHKPRDASYFQALKPMEDALTPAAGSWWFGAPARELAVMLASWVHAFKNVATRNGFTAHRYIKSRGVYASRPTFTGLQTPMLGWVKK